MNKKTKIQKKKIIKIAMGVFCLLLGVVLMMYRLQIVDFFRANIAENYLGILFLVIRLVAPFLYCYNFIANLAICTLGAVNEDLDNPCDILCLCASILSLVCIFIFINAF